ncbi:hypothetical protein LUD75_18420 [Epilithonimonas sp. JDS]|nr:hypothetical protein [Epilithonimonas sp. JDS]
MKRKSITFLMFLLISSIVFSQIQTSVSLDRWKNKKGTFILWYGNGGKASEYAAFTVKFDDSYEEFQVAQELKKKAYKSSKYITYEFLENYDCNQTYGYLARSLNLSLRDVKDLRNGNCADVNYSFVKSAEDGPVFTPENKSKMSPYVEQEEKSLIAQGWKKIYEDYQTAACAAEIRFLPGHSYTAIGAVTSTKSGIFPMLAAYNGDNRLGDIRKNIENNLATLGVYDLKEDISVLKGTYFIDASGEPVSGACLLVFERPFDFKRSFYSLLEARHTGFKEYKGMKGNITENNEQIYYSNDALGYQEAKILESSATDEYIIVLDSDNPKTLLFLDNLDLVMKELPALGFTSKDYKNNAGGDVTEFKKNGENVMMIASYPAKNTAYFYIFKKK